MNRRRAVAVAVVALVLVVVHMALVRAMAHGHVAHVLLGSGSSAPPVGAALLAVSLVVVRFAAVVLAPGALLSALASLAAHVVVGPPRGDGHGDEAGTGTSSGTGSRSEPAGSGDGPASETGARMEGRGT